MLRKCYDSPVLSRELAEEVLRLSCPVDVLGSGKMKTERLS